MHTELRILNGLHRGGILPLDEATLLIGAHEDADVVLVDPGICAHHASLQTTDDGWMLTADAGPVFNTETASAQMLLDLQVGDFFRLGETWLVISDSGAAWQNVPQVVVHSEVDEDGFDDVPINSTATESLFSTEADPLAEAMSDAHAEPVMQYADPEVVDGSDGSAQSAAQSSSAPSAAKRFRLPRWRNWMIAPASLFALLSAVAAYAYTAKPSLPKLIHPEMPAAWHTEKSTSAVALTDKADGVVRSDAGTSQLASSLSKSSLASSSAQREAAAPPSPQALQAAFRKRMKDADLLQRFDLDLTDTAWSMRAHLDDEEGARFERILKAFVVDNKITFPISAKVGSAESMLPFQIRQIVTGVNAGIVTGDGDRVYVGDELLGVKLVAVVDNHLTFMGKRKIEVIW